MSRSTFVPDDVNELLLNLSPVKHFEESKSSYLSSGTGGYSPASFWSDYGAYKSPAAPFKFSPVDGTKLSSNRNIIVISPFNRPAFDRDNLARMISFGEFKNGCSEMIIISTAMAQISSRLASKLILRQIISQIKPSHVHAVSADVERAKVESECQQTEKDTMNMVIQQLDYLQRQGKRIYPIRCPNDFYKEDFSPAIKHRQKADLEDAQPLIAKRSKLLPFQRPAENKKLEDKKTGLYSPKDARTRIELVPVWEIDTPTFQDRKQGIKKSQTFSLVIPWNDIIDPANKFYHLGNDVFKRVLKLDVSIDMAYRELIHEVAYNRTKGELRNLYKEPKTRDLLQEMLNDYHQKIKEIPQVAPIEDTKVSENNKDKIIDYFVKSDFFHLNHINIQASHELFNIEFPMFVGLALEARNHFYDYGEKTTLMYPIGEVGKNADRVFTFTRTLLKRILPDVDIYFEIKNSSPLLINQKVEELPDGHKSKKSKVNPHLFVLPAGGIKLATIPEDAPLAPSALTLPAPVISRAETVVSTAKQGVFAFSSGSEVEELSETSIFHLMSSILM